MIVVRSVLDFEGTSALQLDSIMHDGALGKPVGAKAGAGVVHFQQANRAAGVVLDSHLNVGRVAAYEGEAGGEYGYEPKSCERGAILRHSWVTFPSEGGELELTRFSSLSRRLSSSGRR